MMLAKQPRTCWSFELQLTPNDQNVGMRMWTLIFRASKSHFQSHKHILCVGAMCSHRNIWQWGVAKDHLKWSQLKRFSHRIITWFGRSKKLFLFWVCWWNNYFYWFFFKREELPKSSSDGVLNKSLRLYRGKTFKNSLSEFFEPCFLFEKGWIAFGRTLLFKTLQQKKVTRIKRGYILRQNVTWVRGVMYCAFS